MHGALLGGGTDGGAGVGSGGSDVASAQGATPTVVDVMPLSAMLPAAGPSGSSSAAPSDNAGSGQALVLPAPAAAGSAAIVTGGNSSCGGSQEQQQQPGPAGEMTTGVVGHAAVPNPTAAAGPIPAASSGQLAAHVGG
jgi:hypothetical protein